jgi:hypothetical protein
MAGQKNSAMSRRTLSRRQTRVTSFVVRLVEQRTTEVAVIYELLEVASGTLHRFKSLAAIHRFIRNWRPASIR